MKKIVNWKSFFILLAGCIVGSVLVIPYQMALSANLAGLGAKLYFSAVLQSVIIFTPVTFFGLILVGKAGFSLPILEGEDKLNHLKSILAPSVLWGAVGGVLIILLSLLFSGISLEFLNAETAAPIWAGFLASFYGGIAEEALFRLFLMSLFVWLLTKIRIPRNTSIWAVIIITGIIFGLGHLPITSEIVELSAVVVLRAILLNSAGSIIFSLLYWKKGLESAMLAHFSTDIVVHVVTPFIASFFI